MRTDQPERKAGRRRAGRIVRSMTVTPGNFTGFTPDALNFLFALAMNNTKPWFEQHRGDYVELLLSPMQSLVSALAPVMREIDPRVETTPAVDKTISRIYRDIRFSKDKSPFRSNIWITFKRRIPEWKDTPVYFFELLPERYRFGMGYYNASTGTMTQFRKTIGNAPERFLDIVAPIEGVFTIEGDDYKKKVSLPENQRLHVWCKKKFFYLSQNREPDDLLFSGALVSHVAEGFRACAGLYEFLWKLRGEM